jgi:tetratricopeptide (TPR) repeat protein
MGKRREQQKKKLERRDSLLSRFFSWRHRRWGFAFLLSLLTLFAYQPAWKGKPIWDDDAHMTRPELRSLDGLKRIWVQPGATQQYYPVLFSAFWFEHKLWGDAQLGYHLVNIVLHIGAALLLVAILTHLAIPGAWLAAFLFALHPVEVESVAWIAELKNTLSGCFYLGAALVYLRFDETRKLIHYFAALALFLLGLGSKSVIATLAAALLIVLWWKRGRLSWKRDVCPLLPFVVVGAGAGLFTASMERGIVGAHGVEFTLSVLQRCLIAGRAFWFYLGKLIWPTDLAFSYPHWQIDSQEPAQYIPVVALLLVALLLWWRHDKWRGAWATLLYYLVTLGPVLGFLNVYPFRYSFVADHFQYLASIGPFTLAAAASTNAFERRPKPPSSMKMTLAGCLVLALFTLSWKQSGMYQDVETLWRTTLARNSEAWLAHNNLGNLLVEKGQFDEALTHFQRARALNPNAPEVHNNLGNRLRHLGRLDESVAEFEEALRLDSNYAEAHNNLGNTLLRLRRHEQALAHFARALELDPTYAGAENNFGNALLEMDRPDEAAAHFRNALEIDPNFAAAHYNLANYFLQRGQTNEAIERFRKVVVLDPDNAAARTNLGAALQLVDAWDESRVHLERAVALNPMSTEAHNNLANALSRLGRTREALEHVSRAIEIDPHYINALNNAAWILATSTEVALRNGSRAVELAERADRLSGGKNAVIRSTLAAALAECGRLPDAARTAEQALRLANSAGQAALAETIGDQLASYRSAVVWQKTFFSPQG